MDDYLFIPLWALFIFSLQYVLCCKTKRIWLQCIPAYIVLLLILLAVLCLTCGSAGSFLDFRGVLACLILAWALLTALSAGAAWGFWRIRSRKKELQKHAN